VFSVYGCKTWSLTLSEEHRLRVFESSALRIILVFGPKRDEVTGGRIKLHNEELRDLCSSPSVIRMIKSRRMRLEGHIAQIKKNRNAYRLLMGKDHCEDQDMGGRIILNGSWRHMMGWCGLNWRGSAELL
jgi:hypothetical protein